MELEIQINKISQFYENLLNLQWVEEVEDHLQERTENHSEEEDNHQDDDVVVGIIFLSPSTDGLQQELMSFNNVENWNDRSQYKVLHKLGKSSPV